MYSLTYENKMVCLKETSYLLSQQIFFTCDPHYWNLDLDRILVPFFLRTIFWILLVLLIICFLAGPCNGKAVTASSFDKAPEDSVKKLCLVIVGIVSEHNWLGAEGFSLWDELLCQQGLKSPGPAMLSLRFAASSGGVLPSMWRPVIVCLACQPTASWHSLMSPFLFRKGRSFW